MKSTLKTYESSDKPCCPSEIFAVISAYQRKFSINMNQVRLVFFRDCKTELVLMTLKEFKFIIVV